MNTSGRAHTARPALELLGVTADTPMITRDMVAHAKPDPDLFLAAAALLDIEPRHAYVVGDSVWDLLAARRAQSIGIGLMSGGYGREELERAGRSGAGHAGTSHAMTRRRRCGSPARPTNLVSVVTSVGWRPSRERRDEPAG